VGENAEPLIVVAGVAAHQAERGLDANLVSSSDRAFGLFDNDPAVQGALQLIGECLDVADLALLQQCDGGQVAQGLEDLNVVVVEAGVGAFAEDIQRADRFAAPPQREGVHHVEADRGGSRGEPGPAVTGAQIRVDHRLSGAVRLFAGAFMGLGLEDLDGSRALVGRGGEL
jgi:hypothetical protein